MNDGHFGARKFWRNYLPRLKYHNPAVPMSVNRTTDQEGPSTLTVFLAPPRSTFTTSSSSPSSSPTTADSLSKHSSPDRAESIDMKNIRDSDIFSLLMALTKATPVIPTPEETAEQQQLKDDLELSRQDAQLGAKYREKLKLEKALLDQARGAALEI